MKHLKVEEEDGGSDKDIKVEEVDEEEMDGGDRSNVIGSTNEGFSLTVDGMSNSLAMSFQWLDKVTKYFYISHNQIFLNCLSLVDLRDYSNIQERSVCVCL